MGLSQQQIDTVVSMYRAGHHVLTIQEHVKTSEQTIRNYAKRYGCLRKGNRPRTSTRIYEHEDRVRVLAEQGGMCAICGDALVLEAGLKNTAHMDHCHTRRVIRGVLCRGCNTGLGGFRDRPELLSVAIEYLRNHNS